jgi:hypothetical protein
MSSKQKIIKPFEGFQEKFVRSNLDLVIGGGSMGGGKLNPLYTPVLTTKGWVKMGDLKVGDLVCTPFGNPSPILQIFEHKSKDIYKLETLDGRITYCGLEHLWSFRTTKQIAKYRIHGDMSRNLTTEDTERIIERMKKGQAIYLPISNAQEFTEKKYVIHPYVLGVLLGDGCLVERFSETSFVISNTEQDIINKVAGLSNATRVRNCNSSHSKTFFSPLAKDYNKYMSSIGLLTYSYNKFIPNEYLWGSIEQRKQLLYGLMDTDGCVEDKNRFSFSTTSKQLAEDFIYLCRSLGYIATLKMDKRSGKYTKGIAYDISISTDDIIFSSEKHLKRYYSNLDKSTRKYARTNDHIRIKSIVKHSNSDARCIYIEDDLHLYIIDDFIVTHNSAAAVLSIAEPVLDSKFRAVFLRNNLGDLKSGGGILDEFKKMYGSWCNVVESGDPHVDFPSGARIDVTHIADQSKEKVLQRFKGRQYDFIYFDEGTGFTWECFTAVYSRNRGMAKWTGKVRMTTNPKRNHWLRKFLDWYIGADGFIIPERDGVVRYFYINGETVNDVVWGDTKEEVYKQCKINIDRTLAKFNGKTGTATYKDMIKSFTFYEGKMSGNKAILESNSGYVGSVAVMGGREAQANLEGNWNVDTDEELDAPITGTEANQCFLNDPQRNNDKWVTCDLADTGTDNFLCLAWDGFHVYDYLILKQTTPRQNAERLEMFAQEHDVSNSHIIYDAIRGTYINDYIPEAVPFISNHAPVGMYGRMAYNLKAECYMRLVEAIKRQYISFDDSITYRIYDHANLTQAITIQDEFREECAVVRFKDMPSGKKALMSKKEMNAKLGKNRSMDLLDPCAMRFYPVLEYAYGDELMATMMTIEKNDDDDDDLSIYDETLYA